MRIVVLDDEELIVKGLISMIEEQRLPDTSAQGFLRADQVLAHLSQNRADLIFADIRMPKMDGIAFIEAVRARDSAVPIVVLSGYQEFAYAQKAIRYNVLEYLTKPVDPGELGKVLNAAFASTHRLAPQQYRSIFPETLGLREADTRACSPALLKILQYIDGHLLDSDISLTVLGDYTGLHPSYISALFHRELHITYSKYLHMQKMKRALSLLGGARPYSVGEVAVMLGYTGERQFYRVFKATFGMTPSQLRRQAEPFAGPLGDGLDCRRLVPQTKGGQG